MIIHFKVREQTLWAYGCESPVGGSIDYISCEFEFLTKDWDNAPGRYAVFTLKDTDPAVSYTAVIVDGKIDEDAHINLSDGIWNVNVVGVSEDGQRITTCDCPILVDKPSIQLPMFPEIKQDVGEKILAVAGEAKKQVDNAIEKVDEAIEKVDNLTEIAMTVEDSANRAAVSADEANQSAILAESAKENAIASEGAANAAANTAIGALKEADAAAARAKESAANALVSENNAKTSESNAKESENESKAALESVKELEKSASDKADETAVSAANAKDSENAASESANSAAESAEEAKNAQALAEKAAASVDTSLGISDAKVGDFMMIGGVDENGAPTGYDATRFPIYTLDWLEKHYPESVSHEDANYLGDKIRQIIIILHEDDTKNPPDGIYVFNGDATHPGGTNDNDGRYLYSVVYSLQKGDDVYNCRQNFATNYITVRRISSNNTKCLGLFYVSGTGFLDKVGIWNSDEMFQVTKYDWIDSQWVKDKCLTKGNTTEYTPSADYHPATKKYVDDSIGVVTDEDILNMLAKHDIIDIVADNNGNILTDNNSNVLIY